MKYLIYLFLLVQVISFSQSQNILLLDDFENFPDNSLGEATATFADTIDSDITKLTAKDFNAFCRVGRSLQLNYELSQDSSGFCGFVSFLPIQDLSNFHYFSFWVKSEQGLDMIQLELERLNGEKSKISIWNYLECGTNREWQKVVIPLDAFWNLTEKTEIVKLVVSFESRSSYLNESPLSGIVYFDEMLFGSYFPGYLKIDPFSDKLTANGTGANNGSFAPSGSEDNYTNQLICSNFSQNECECHLRLDFDNGADDDFGGYFGILGGGIDGWTKIGQSINQYDTLYLEAFAQNSASNPGNFKVELKTDSVNLYETQITGIDNIQKSFSTAISEFDIIGSPNLINEFTIVFEEGQQEVLSGTVFVDEIELRAEGAQIPDTNKPDPPQNITINGNPPLGLVSLSPNTEVNISLNIENDNPRLESIRLEYLTGCKWHCLLKEFSPLSTETVFNFNTIKLPQSTEIEMRVVLENYNGQSCPSDAFSVIVDNDEISLDNIFKSSFEVFQFLRAETGVYLDATVLDPNATPFHPASVATTGMGLISLCIADAMGWIDNAEELVLETLATMNGLRPGFIPERNCTGWFRHFIDEETGRSPEGWYSEFSSIDSGILAAGGLFSKSYFSSNDSIGTLADNLYLSIDWASMIENPETGGIYREADSLGNRSGITRPFNEYMIVAWLAKNYFRDNDLANELWNLHYADPINLLKSDTFGIEVLTDVSGNFLPNFIPQFNYFLCNYFATTPSYLVYFENAMRVDSLWWRMHTDTYCFVSGFGAGSSSDWVPNGYHADNLLEHPGTICSPHIIGGFIPINPEIASDLINLYTTPLGLYTIPNTEIEFLWRFSTEDPAWQAFDIQGIDFSSLLLGIAAHSDFLGGEFFKQHNDFDFPSENSLNFSPKIIVDSFPQSILLEDCEKLILVNDLVHDLNHATSLLTWSASGTENVQVETNSPCEIIVSADSSLVSVDTIVLIVIDPDAGSDTVSLIVDIPAECRVVGINETKEQTNRIELFQNYPNPFDNLTIIPFVITHSENVIFSIFDLNGQVITSKNLGHLFPGDYEIYWDGKDDKGELLTAGIFIYSIKSENFHITKKMMLSK